MPTFSCQQNNPDGLNYLEESLYGGSLWIEIAWTWDGTSVWPDCDGPVQSIHVRNNSTTTTYYCILPHKSRGATYVTCPPSSDQTFNDTNTLRQAGMNTFLMAKDPQFTDVQPV